MKILLAAITAIVATITLSVTAYAEKDKDKDKDDEADFTGSYTYTSTFTISLTSPQTATMTDSDTGHLTIASSKKAGLVLTFTAKGETCQLTATRSGKTGLKPAMGQSCSMEDKDNRAEYTITLTSGSGNLTGDSLSLNLGWKLTGSIAGVSVAGRATESVQAEQK